LSSTGERNLIPFSFFFFLFFSPSVGSMELRHREPGSIRTRRSGSSPTLNVEGLDAEIRSHGSFFPFFFFFFFFFFPRTGERPDRSLKRAIAGNTMRTAAVVGPPSFSFFSLLSSTGPHPQQDGCEPGSLRHYVRSLNRTSCRANAGYGDRLKRESPFPLSSSFSRSLFPPFLLPFLFSAFVPDWRYGFEDKTFITHGVQRAVTKREGKFSP